MKHYDAIIIGAGQAGIPLAKKLAKAGKQTVIIEKSWVGGSCINYGCTPTKAMIASAQAAHQARKAPDLGINIGDIHVDFKKIKERKDEIVKMFRTSAQKSIESTEGLELVLGEASFSGEKELTITSIGKKEIVTGDWIFINTGAEASIPKLKGLKSVNYLTSTSILELEEIPEHLIIIGGSYIGLEFGQMFYRFGSKVTVLEEASRIMEQEDEDVSAELTKILQDEGLDILTGINIDEIKSEMGQISLNLHSTHGANKITGSHLLIATGRIPQIEPLNLEIPGIGIDETGNIIVNEKLETNVGGIYALGDVKGGPAFTHISYYDFTIVYRNLIEKTDYSIADRPVPYCMFTDPQLGRIGLSENDAIKKGLEFMVAKIPMSKVARGIETNETLGFMKAVVDPKSKKILGASILSSEGGEIMSVIQMAMEGGITYDRLKYCVFAHPTYTEALNNLFKKLYR
jgi:pyruvate/2-oxoglutarate dehydrogenase complex dihydrolipoamide dehydrogenase (E3) component